jgi:hypothetical protein
VAEGRLYKTYLCPILEYNPAHEAANFSVSLGQRSYGRRGGGARPTLGQKPHRPQGPAKAIVFQPVFWA